MEPANNPRHHLGTLRLRAIQALFLNRGWTQIRHLAVGKAAQEIEGVDQDGQQFKLSDYRGKVVLLYFWSEF